MLVTPDAPIDRRYFGDSGLSLRGVVFGFKTASAPGGGGLARMLKRPGCCSWPLTTLPGMDATAPVLPPVPWAEASEASATTPASKTKRSQRGTFSEAMLVTPNAPTDRHRRPRSRPASSQPNVAHLPPPLAPCEIIATAFWTVSVPDTWLGGYSLKVMRNCPTMLTAGTMVQRFAPVCQTIDIQRLI
jgi:hypothetical protein